jgi:hypothetical protein
VRPLWSLQTRCTAKVEKIFFRWGNTAKLDGAIGRCALALQERAQQTCEAATVVRVHGGKLDGHSMTGGDATDDTTRADLTCSGGED